METYFPVYGCFGISALQNLLLFLIVFVFILFVFISPQVFEVVFVSFFCGIGLGVPYRRIFQFVGQILLFYEIVPSAARTVTAF